jgi:hypothetical protein
MADKCYLCQRNEASDWKEMSFVYDGINFSPIKFPGTCEDCEKKNVIERFEKFGREFISLKDGKVKIDWKFFSEAYWHERDSHLIRILQDMGIFSYKAEGNWELVSVGVCWLGPVKTGGPLYFTREEDIKEFARLNYATVLYRWQIRQIGKVMSRREILKK